MLLLVKFTSATFFFQFWPFRCFILYEFYLGKDSAARQISNIVPLLPSKDRLLIWWGLPTWQLNWHSWLQISTYFDDFLQFLLLLLWSFIKVANMSVTQVSIGTHAFVVLLYVFWWNLTWQLLSIKKYIHIGQHILLCG